jgi:RNA polymerase sigma factor (sigma-70 family)
VTQSDDELAADFTARRPAALAAAYERHIRVLYAVARSVLGGDEAAEDCVHDALLRVWQTPGSYRTERGPLRAFLIACVRNEAMSMLRSGARRLAREERAERLAPVADSTFEVVDHVEARRLREALASLPAEQRAALELVYFGNRTHAQAAAQLGVPLGTVKSRISLAVRKLQSLVSPPEGAA